MGNPPRWVAYSNNSRAHGEVIMPGISAGVKTSADVNVQPSQRSKLSRNLQNPAPWSYIWVGGAFAYLVMTYFGIMRLSRVGK